MKRALFFANSDWYLYSFRLSLARDRVVTHFSLERMADSYRGLWEEVISQ